MLFHQNTRNCEHTLNKKASLPHSSKYIYSFRKLEVLSLSCNPVFLTLLGQSMVAARRRPTWFKQIDVYGCVSREGWSKPCTWSSRREKANMASYEVQQDSTFFTVQRDLMEFDDI
ncbi:hypothetical protein PanWU01x14_012430 [Parasponia andersonii]|uniref:Uncharacterized protein n=1 Tax=Parasponia andersonii TaxID=3476 RepID=A0A2P5E1X1_PARAD|nr:hypothetical protein PanWU01x14_012430 [Parasponia andersonii]